MPNDDEESKFPDEIRAAFESYPKPRTSPDFEARFWSSFDARRGRYRGFLGFLRRVVEVEIEGVAVWRLALSTLSGGAVCALALGITLGSPSSQAVPVAPLPLSIPLPQREIPSVALNAFAFYNRDWENDFLGPQPKPQTAPHQARPHGDDLSWNGSNAHWA